MQARAMSKSGLGSSCLATDGRTFQRLALHRRLQFGQQQHRCRIAPQALPEVGLEASTSAAASGLSSELEQFALQVAVLTHADPLYQLADGERAGGWLAPWVNFLESVLVTIQGQLDKVHIPYSYGFSIILLTLFVKVLTFPVVKKQVESTMAVQSLKPRIDLIKQRFGEDKEKIQKETSILYEQAGVNPLAGCLPSLATIPIFIGLFNSLTNVANDGLLDTQGFLWVPTLAGPTSLAARQEGLGTAWLYPFVDGAPPIGWHDALCYLSLPVLIVACQYLSNAIIQPPMDPKDENYNTSRGLMIALPLMLGWFSLNVPAGLSLYYLSNTVLTSAQQIYLKKLGGANVKVNDLGPVTKPGSGRRLGVVAGAAPTWKPTTVLSTTEQKAAADAAAEAAAQAVEAAEAAAYAGGVEAAGTAAAAYAGLNADAAKGAAAAAAAIDPAKVSRRVKRKKLSLLGGSGLPTEQVATVQQPTVSVMSGNA